MNRRDPIDADGGSIDREGLTEVVKRAPLLLALVDGPVSASELERTLSASRSTIHRATRSFVEKGFLAKSGDGYRLTGLGRVVTTRMSRFETEYAAATRLEPFLNNVDPSAVELPLEHFADATVTRPRPGTAHFAVKRLTELMADAESMRLFSRVVSPIYVDACYRQVQEGMEIEAIFSREVVDLLFAEYGSDAREAAKTDRFEVRIHDSCPFELFIFDASVGMTTHDENGVTHAFVESDAPEVLDWATALFDRYESESEYATFI